MKTLVLAILALLFTSCAVSDAMNDSKSNWLRTCSAASDCGADLSCTCGVCTRTCESEPDCGDHAAACTDVGVSELAAACAVARASAEQGVCLRTCERSSDCGDEQRCVRGSCVGVGRTPDGGPVLDAAGLSPVGPDGGGEPPLNADGGRSPRPIRDDEMLSVPDAAPPPPNDYEDAGNALSCAATARPCCDAQRSCEQGLVCHYDESCIAPGSSDELGIATVVARLHPDASLLAADDQAVYGLVSYGIDGPFDVMRWSVAGGEQVLVSGIGNLRRIVPAMVVADGQLYFTARETADDLSYSLMRIHTDGSGSVEHSGPAGSRLIQDAEHLYFTNDGDSRVLRLAKAAFGLNDQRQAVYTSTSDAPGTIASLAINGTGLFGVELPPQTDGVFTSEYSIWTADKTTLATSTLTTSERFTNTGIVPTLLASDAFLLVQTSVIDRMNLSTNEVSPLISSYVSYAAVMGDRLFVSREGAADDVDLNTGRRADIVPAGNRLWHMVVAGQDLFARIQFTNDFRRASLVRIER